MTIKMLKLRNDGSNRNYYLRVSGSPVAFGLFLFVIFFLLRSLVTFPVEHIDAMHKYDAASRIAKGHGLQELLRNQHTMRWIQTLPQAGVAWLTSHRFEGLYLLPLAVFAGYCSLFLLAGRKFLGPAQLAVLALLLLIEPIALNHTGQLLNPPFGVFFVVAGAMVLTRGGSLSSGAVIAASLLFFAAYASHVTYLSFAGGALIWLLIGEKRVRSALLFAIVITVCILLEMFFFNFITPEPLPLGRVQALAQTAHVQKVQTQWLPINLTALLFERWTRAPVFDQIMICGFAFFCVFSLLQWKNGQSRLSAFTSLSLIMASSYAFALTFAVASLNPIRPFIPTRPMYLEPIAPFAIFACVCLLAQAEKQLSTKVVWSLRGNFMLFMLLLLVVEVKNHGSFSHIINARVNAFMWRSHSALSEYSHSVRNGSVILTAVNPDAMVMLARYPQEASIQQPGRLLVLSDALGDAFRVSHLRQIPLDRNYEDCETHITLKSGY